MIKYKETVVQEIDNPALQEAGVRLLIKREDQNHQTISGNKWWKLRYNLEEALRLQKKLLITFGGAYSNHIFATAAAAHELGLKSIGIIRGEETLPLNNTLSFAREHGMRLHYINRESYSHKTENEFIHDLEKQFGSFYLIPEGGTNAFALRGCVELAQKTLSEINFDYLCLPVGTGGTMAGMIAGLRGEKQVIGFSALKGGDFLDGEVDGLLRNHSTMHFANWRIEHEYHFGGYGKSTVELTEFIQQQWKEYKLPLDGVYTSKMIFGIYDLVRKGNFRRGSTILALHTGGLQGRSFEN